MKGKVVLISRGNSSFADKANAAIQAGAAAAVIYNNAPGSINMNLTGYNFPNPAVMIEQAKAKEILAASTQDETTRPLGRQDDRLRQGRDAARRGRRL